MHTTGMILLALLCGLVYRLGSFVRGVRDEIAKTRTKSGPDYGVDDETGE